MWQGGKGHNIEVAPDNGWVNAISDAVGVVDFKINGSTFAWTGVAYHDKLLPYFISLLPLPLKLISLT